MRIKDCKRTYENFDRFIEEFIINKNSILTDNEGILTEESVNKCIEL